jgi:hypothetical protein
MDDNWGDENDDNLGFDSPTDSDEHIMNEDDCAPDGPGDGNEEYPRDDDDGQPDEAQEWHDFDPDC